MVRSRLTRDPRTGKSHLYNIDTGKTIDYSPKISSDINNQEGDGIIDSVTSVGHKIAAKLTGKVAKDLAKKAVEKAVEKGAEKVGSKTGKIIANKLDNTFNKKPTEGNKGHQIIEILKTQPLNQQEEQSSKPKPNDNVDSKYDVLRLEFDKLINI